MSGFSHQGDLCGLRRLKEEFQSALSRSYHPNIPCGAARHPRVHQWASSLCSNRTSHNAFEGQPGQPYILFSIHEAKDHNQSDISHYNTICLYLCNLGLQTGEPHLRTNLYTTLHVQ